MRRKSGRKFGMIRGKAHCQVQENKNQEGQGSMDLELSHNNLSVRLSLQKKYIIRSKKFIKM